jgi:preprotein translocase subunit SecE
METIRKYVRESWDELMHKVSWPTWKQLQSSSVLVLVATFIIAGIIYLMDSAFGNLLKLIYNNIFN